MWQEFKAECSRCNRCKSESLLDPEAFPILMKSSPRATDILFVLEAPNRDDTYNPDKGYLTIDPETDPSGRFFYDLFVNELRFDIDQDLFVTNSVLCLSAKNDKSGKYPVTSPQQSNCSGILRRMIDVFNPIIICPVGRKALLAIRQIEKHDYGSMADAVGRPTRWYGRTLFPLYHTSSQARNPRNGRIEGKQRADWQSLRANWKKVRAEMHTDKQRR